MEIVFVGLRTVKEMVMIDGQIHIKPKDDDDEVIVVDLVEFLKKQGVYLDFKLYDTQINTFTKLHVENNMLYLVYDTYNFDRNIKTIGEISYTMVNKHGDNIRCLTPYVVMSVEII